MSHFEVPISLISNDYVADVYEDRRKSSGQPGPGLYAWPEGLGSSRSRSYDVL